MKRYLILIILCILSINTYAKEVSYKENKSYKDLDLTIKSDNFNWEREVLWQALHVMDVAQTIKGPAKDPCYHERNFITKTLIGKYPNTDKVIIWGIGWGLLHYQYSKWLDNTKKLKPSVKTALRFLDFTSKGITITNNVYSGITVFTKNNHNHVKKGGYCNN